MCGIVGVICRERQAAYDIYNALLNLQHRGQDAAGIVVMNGGARVTRKKGLVHHIFDENIIAGLQGHFGIGQVRYPTTPEKLEPQPLYCDFSGIAMAHNGHIINHRELQQALAERGIYCDTGVDIEPVLKAFSHLYLREGPADPATRCIRVVSALMRLLLGSYSVVAAIRGAGILAFRDPRGIRPLVFGRKDGCFAFASESVALHKLGYSHVHDVSPGEAIFIDTELRVTREVIRQDRQACCMFEWVYFSRAPSVIEGIKVNKVRGRLGEELARAYMASGLYELHRLREGTIVAPVPETARPAAKMFSEVTGFVYKDVLEKNRYAGRFFIKPTELIRERETEMGLETFPEAVQGKTVLLVDDSIVRGTTSRRIVSLLREAGAREVHLLVTCPPLISPCRYGIDIPTKEELIAARMPPEEVGRYIRADSLLYQTLEGLVRAIGLPQDRLCLACLTGEYPTPQEGAPVVLESV